MLLTQCKAGYNYHRPKADVEFANQQSKLKENFPENSAELDVRNIQVLFHKLDGYKDHRHLVTVKYKDFMKLLTAYKNELLRTPRSKSEPDKG